MLTASHESHMILTWCLLAKLRIMWESLAYWILLAYPHIAKFFLLWHQALLEESCHALHCPGHARSSQSAESRRPDEPALPFSGLLDVIFCKRIWILNPIFIKILVFCCLFQLILFFWILAWMIRFCLEPASLGCDTCSSATDEAWRSDLHHTAGISVRIRGASWCHCGTMLRTVAVAV